MADELHRFTNEEMARIEAAHEPLTDYQLAERRMVARDGHPTHPVDALHLILEIERLRRELGAMSPGSDSTMSNEEPTPAEAIVRELAARGPFFEETNSGGLLMCIFCLKLEATVLDGEEGSISDPSDHESSCLWRRAKALYPGE